MPVYIEKVQVWSDVTIAGRRTKKERWTAEMSKKDKDKNMGGRADLQRKARRNFHLSTKTMKMKSNSKRQNDKDKYTR